MVLRCFIWSKRSQHRLTTSQSGNPKHSGGPKHPSLCKTEQRHCLLGITLIQNWTMAAYIPSKCSWFRVSRCLICSKSGQYNVTLKHFWLINLFKIVSTFQFRRVTLKKFSFSMFSLRRLLSFSTDYFKYIGHILYYLNHVTGLSSISTGWAITIKDKTTCLLKSNFPYKGCAMNLFT